MARCAGGAPVLLWCFGAGGRCWSLAVRCCGAALRCCGAAVRGGRAPVLGSLDFLDLVLPASLMPPFSSAITPRHSPPTSVGSRTPSVMQSTSVWLTLVG